MFKGEPGTRKSTQALSFPTPQYWFSHDKKMASLLKPMKMWGIDATQVEYDNYSDYTKMEMKLKSLQTNCKAKTIVVDSITSEGDSINSQTIDMISGTKTTDGSDKGGKRGGIEINTIEDYKAEAAAFSETVKILKDIQEHFGVNIILIAHVVGERKPEEKKQSTHFARIIVTGGKVISAKIPAYCDEIYHFNVDANVDLSKEGAYGLVTSHTGDDYARTCLPLDKKIVFNDQPLYKGWIKQAIDKLNGQQPTQNLK